MTALACRWTDELTTLLLDEDLMLEECRETAQMWVHQGFHPEHALAWIESGTFSAQAARAMCDRGLTPAWAGQRPYNNHLTLGMLISEGVNTINEAVEALGAAA